MELMAQALNIHAELSAIMLLWISCLESVREYVLHVVMEKC